MITLPGLFRGFRIAFTIFVIGLAGCAAPRPTAPSVSQADRGIPQPDRYAALLAKAERGALRITRGETAEAPPALMDRPASRAMMDRAPADAAPAPANVFTGKYRKTAKTTFTSARVETFRSLETLFEPLTPDHVMVAQFPQLKGTRGNDTARVAPERRNVKVRAWLYWAARESDRDFHVILGNTAQLTSATLFMNTEVSGLPEANPTKRPFPQQQSDIRAILAKHRHKRGLFVTPVPVEVTGSLLWDGEHRAPHTVGPEGLRPTKAWEIHPIKKIVER
ncbi:MAG TPA: hypothetical protein VEX43_18440 [Chthoniobacterales bacterium]|nr:hypothetical protein [Chthoniobacterales bacterium]